MKPNNNPNQKPKLGSKPPMKCWRCITIKFAIEDEKRRASIVIDDAVTVYHGNAVCLQHFKEQLPNELQWTDEPINKSTEPTARETTEAEKSPGYLKVAKLVMRAQRLTSVWEKADSDDSRIKIKAEAKRLYSDLDSTWGSFTDDQKNEHRDELFEAFSPIMREIFETEPTPGKRAG